jgi:hypothetical protein
MTKRSARQSARTQKKKPSCCQEGFDFKWGRRASLAQSFLCTSIAADGLNF